MSDRIEIKSDGSWEFHGEDSHLHDRTKGQKVNYRVFNPLTKQYEYQVMNLVFCMNCGAAGGLSAQSALWVKYLCDKCYESGDWSASFMPMLPDEEYAFRNGIRLDKEASKNADGV